MKLSATRGIAKASALGALLLPLVLFTACRTADPVVGEEARATAARFSFWQPHRLLMSEAGPPAFEVEIDHVDGAGPTAAELQSLTEFFQAHCRKPGGVRLRVDAPIPRDRARGKSHLALGELHLDGPAQSGTAFAYFLFYDSRVTGTPKQAPTTSRIPFSGAVFVDRRFIDAWARFPGAGDLARRMVLHEAGHVLGLSDNQAHGDGLHCTNFPCLMNASLLVRFPRLVLPGPVVPQRDFCDDCKADLRTAAEQPPARNLRFLGPYCVRSEAGYHVVSTAGFASVHVGSLNDLDLAALTRRRHAKFNEHPSPTDIATEVPELPLSVARKLVPQLERDPLKMLRSLAADMRRKIEEIDRAAATPKP